MTRRLFIAALLISAGCTTGEGSFSVGFIWPAGGAPDLSAKPYYAWAELQYWQDGRSEGATTLAQAGPVKLGDSTSELRFSQLQYGPERVVVVTVRGSENSQDGVLYFGLSDMFELKAGRDTVVPVTLNLQPAPGTDESGDKVPGVVRIMKNGSEASYVNDPAVTLRLKIDPGSVARVTVANDVAFSTSAVTLPVTAMTLAGDGDYEWPDLWDLNKGLSPEASGLDGQRSVFARLVNGYGVESRILDAHVTLDRTPPGINAKSISSRVEPQGLCPLAPENVKALSAGSLAVIAFTVSEQLDGPPVMTASNGSTELPFTADGPQGTSWRMTYKATGEEPPGVYSLAVVMTDFAGNVNTEKTVSTEFPFIVLPAGPALIVDQAKVTYVRSPWGRAEPEDLGSFTIPAGPYYELGPADPLSDTAVIGAGAFVLKDGAPPSMIVVRTDDARGDEMGVAVPNSAGEWPRIPLRMIDVPAVRITALDASCMETAPVVLENSEWVATHNLGDAGRNASVLHKVGISWPALAPDMLTSSAQKTGADGTAEGRVTSVTGTRWMQLAYNGRTPDARFNAAAAYDSARGRLVVFGGTGGFDPLGDTWEWDGQNWVLVAPSDPGPQGRYGHSMAYDSVRGRVLMFGGMGGSGYYGDTWEWDGANWVQKRPAHAPSARFGHAMAFDAGSGKVVLFGGAGDLCGEEGCSDTWEWDGTDWRMAVVASTPVPTGRAYHAMTFDSFRGVVVMSGGLNLYDGTMPDETWEYNGFTASWREKAPDGGPGGRMGHGIAYDANRGRTVLFAGLDEEGLLGDTWEYDGKSWTLRATDGPAPRSGLLTVWDEQAGGVLQFGGSDGMNTLGDIWRWDGARWFDETGAPDVPGERYHHALVYSPVGDRTVLFGGAFMGTELGDTWEWSGASWAEKTPSTGSPEARYAHAATGAAGAGITVFGGTGGSGLLGDTWLWNGASWALLEDGSAGPGERSESTMAYNTKSGVSILFGGVVPGDQCLDDTWSWDGAKWTGVQTADSPGARYGAAMAYDSARDRVVLFGGSCTEDGTAAYFGDTWEFDGEDWKKVDGGTGPQGRRGHSMAFDPDTGRTVVFGGTSADRSYNDLWEWDGAVWNQRKAASEPPAGRSEAAMVYERSRGRLLLFGGYLGLDGTNDLWEGRIDPYRTPAVQFTASLKDARIGYQGITMARVRAYSGGTAYPFTTDSDGSKLFGWSTGGSRRNPGSWALLGANGQGYRESGPVTETPITWSSSSPDEAREYIVERDGTMGFRVRPAGASGIGGKEAAVNLDYIELRVRYSTK